MAGAGKGRHRAPTSARAPAAVLLVVVVVAVAAIGAAVVLLTDGEDEPAAVVESTVSPSPGETALTQLSATRVTNASGHKVTVREVTIVTGGSGVRVRPNQERPAAGLERIGARVVGDDGTTEPFSAPVALESGGKLTVEGTYRLTHCPDVLPTSWPSPVSVVAGEWDRIFTRIEVPQSTARALCPKDKSRSKSLRALSGKMVQNKRPVVRLRWNEARPLTILTIGSASGVAARTPQSACGGRCIESVKRRSTVRIAIKPVERCAIGGKTNRLTLVVREQGRQKVVTVSVRGLAKAVCARKSAP